MLNQKEDSKVLISLLSCVAFICLGIASISHGQNQYESGKLKVTATGSSNLLVSVTNTITTSLADTTKSGVTNVSGTYLWAAITNQVVVANSNTFAFTVADTTKLGVTNVSSTYLWTAITNSPAISQIGTNAGGTYIWTAQTNAIPAGSAVIGAVTQSGTWNIGTLTTFPDNEPFNVAQVGGFATGSAVPHTNVPSAVYWSTLTNSTANIGNVGITNSAGTYIWAGITNAIPAGDNDIGNVDLEFAGTVASTGSGVLGAQTLRIVMATDNPVLTNNVSAAASGGASSFHLASTASTNTNLVKSTAGTLYWVKAWNTNSTPYWIHIGNVASQMATNTTRAAVVLVPGNTAGSGNNWDCGSIGMNFSTGISFATSTSPSETNLTAIVAGVGIDMGYK